MQLNDLIGFGTDVRLLTYKVDSVDIREVSSFLGLDEIYRVYYRRTTIDYGRCRSNYGKWIVNVFDKESLAVDYMKTCILDDNDGCIAEVYLADAYMGKVDL